MEPIQPELATKEEATVKLKEIGDDFIESRDHNGAETAVAVSSDGNKDDEQPNDDTAAVTKEICPAGRIAMDDPQKLIGKTLGDGYQIVEFVGKGHSGHVFKAQRKGIDGVFAVKIMTPSLSFTKRHNDRFLIEAKSAKELDHPNIIALYDADVTDDQVPFVVTDFFEGEKLSDVLEADGPYEQRKAIDLFLQICDGLIHAHYMGFIHRDVKPGNIRMKIAEKGANQIKISDCGVSKVLPNPGRETRYFTQTGFEYGDATYMSPEQCRGAKIDNRSDIYSLGCLMYQCLSGKPPFNAERTAMLMYKHVRKKPRTLSLRFPDLQLSHDLESLVMRCLEKDPDDRYQSVSDLKEDLETIKANREVRRAFRKKLALKEKHEQGILPESIFPESVNATVSAFWFGLSSTGRLYTIALIIGLFVAAGIGILLPYHNLYYSNSAPSVAPEQTPVPSGDLRHEDPYFSQELGAVDFDTRMDTLKQDATKLKEFALVQDPIMCRQVDILLDDINAALEKRNLAFPKWTASEEAAAVEQLDKRKMALTLELDSQGSYSDSKTIMSLDGRTVLFEAPAGSSRTDAILDAIKNHVDLHGANLRRAPLAGVSIDGANLEGADLSYADLRGATISNTNLKDANLNYTDFRHAQLIRDDVANASLLGTTLDGATMVNTNLGNTHLHMVSLRNADFYGGSLDNTQFDRCDLENFQPIELGTTFHIDGSSELSVITRFKRKLEDNIEKLQDLDLAIERSILLDASQIEVSLPITLERVNLQAVDPKLAEPVIKQIKETSHQMSDAIDKARFLQRTEINAVKHNKLIDTNQSYSFLDLTKFNNKLTSINKAVKDLALKPLLPSQPQTTEPRTQEKIDETRSE